MIKYFCDICGKEVSDTTKLILPILGDKEYKDRNGNVLRKEIDYFDKECDVCCDCEADISALLYYLKNRPNGKVIAIKYKDEDG